MLPVSGDEHRLQQVTWNLLANAIKYTPRGGRLHVTVVRDGESAVIRVRDTGEGIDPQFLPHLFEPFRQGSSKTRAHGARSWTVDRPPSRRTAWRAHHR